jgi:hypothetical protein
VGVLEVTISVWATLITCARSAAGSWADQTPGQCGTLLPPRRSRDRLAHYLAARRGENLKVMLDGYRAVVAGANEVVARYTDLTDPAPKQRGGRSALPEPLGDSPWLKAPIPRARFHPRSRSSRHYDGIYCCDESQRREVVEL